MPNRRPSIDVDRIADTATERADLPARPIEDPDRAATELRVAAPARLRRRLEDLDAGDIVDRPDPPGSPARFDG